VVRFAPEENAMTTRRPTTARLLAGLAPFLLVGLSLPLLAPSCGDFQPGVKTFAKGSLVIPMDVCYQCTRQAADGLDTATSSCARTNYVSPGGNACPGTLAQGDVIKAYGLVYQLIRADVAVYWVIDPQKQALDGYDLAIQYAGGFPVLKLDWASGLPGAAPATASGGTIRYMGGPFVVDGSDAAKAIAVMKANQAAFGAVNVHVTNVAFQASVSKAMAGGWSAGGAVAPKLALLDIGSGNLSTRTTAPNSTCETNSSASCTRDAVPPGATQTWTCIGSAKNAEPVIREYLAKAGIGTGAAGGTAAGPHGEIYDRLTLADFIPAPGSTDWRTSAFGQGGYQILWVPHWVAPGSCSDYASACSCLRTRYTQAQTDQVLRTVGAFSAAGGDVFAECAGLGSFEGAFSGLTGTGYTFDYQDGDPTTRFQTKTGVRYNQLPTNPFPAADYTPDGVSNFASPLMQLGDFPFNPYTGAIEDYKPDDTTAADRNYQAGVTRLIGTRYASGSPTKDRDWDFFTFRDKATGHGSIVYLAGHSYSGVQGSFQAAGSRLVLNTLFNLGAGCTASGVACDTGQFGACSRGVLTCSATGERVCTPTAAPAPQEDCNGIDDDCDGLVDEDLERSCYQGPAGTQGVGQCRAGVQTCQQNPDGSYGYSACQGEVDPTPEGCNGLDDDCDAEVDELGPGVPLSEACYSGPPGTAGVGICRAGTRTCTSGSWGGCAGEVTPAGDTCAYAETHPGVGADADCNGQLDQGCADCVAATTRPCYDGPTGTAGTGLCRNGVQTCNVAGQWGVTCEGAVRPAGEICRNDLDENCNGLTDDDPPFCLSCQFKPSATDPSKPDQRPPPLGTERLDCWTGPDTAVFKSANPASVCVRGFQYCQASGSFGACEQQTLPGPELCNGRDDDCDGTVDEGAECGPGFSCQNGVCVVADCDAAERGCPEGYACGAGTCIAASCGGGSTCAPGTTCSGGACADPCDPAIIKCGTGSTCAGGYCTGGACYAVGCPSGEVCQNGECVADACAGLICPAGTFCRQGDCVQACAIVTCGAGEKCDVDGFCVADPCAGKTCSPTQSCLDGTCREDRCVGTACGAGQRCVDGTCLDDPCAGVVCPVGQCRDGQCYAASRVTAAPAAGDAGGCGGCGGAGASPLALLGLLLALPLARRRRPGRAGRGATLALVAAAGLLSTGCPKESKPFDPLACALLDPPLATCETESRCIDVFTDPSHCGGCGQVCGAGNKCVPGATSGQCAPATQVAPHLLSVSPPAGSVGALAPLELTLAGERLADGATLRATGPAGTATVPTRRLPDGRLQASLDLSTASPGTWTLRVVNPDNVISNGRSFGVAIPTPGITQVVPVPDASPGAATPAVAAGGVRTLRLVGTGLMIASACKISGSTMPEQEVPATLTAAGLECQLDLSAVQPGAYQVRVVNDDSHASQPRPFDVVSAPPVLESVSPSSAPFNTVTGLQLFGAGFDVTSKVWFTGPGFTGGIGQNTTFVDSTRLVVSALDLQHCPASPCAETNAGALPPVQYFVHVRNGALASASRELVIINGAAPSVTNISPTSAWQGDQPVVTITGSNLSAGTVLEYRRPGATAFVPATALQVGATEVSGVVDLIGSPAGSAPAGSYDVRLRFPSGATSASFALRVDSNQAVITATPAPAGGTAGTTVPVTLTVANLRPPQAGVRVRFYDPSAGATFSVEPTPLTFPAADKVVVSLPLAGLQTKVYALAVVNPNGALPSAPYNFTVFPGAPTVSAVACTNVTGAPPGCTTASSARQQPAPVPVRIDGTNFAKPDVAGNNGSQVRVSAPTIGVVDQLLPASAVTVTSATRIDVQLDTTLAVPAAYSISVWNQGGALKSAALANAFTILP
jgi:putative metal-binding protein